MQNTRCKKPLRLIATSGYTGCNLLGGEPITHNATVAERSCASGVLPQNRKFLGSKQRLLDFLTDTILSRVEKIETFADLFAGTGVVGWAFRNHASRIIANDLLYSNYVVNRAFLTSTAANVECNKVADLIEELNSITPVQGYVCRNYGGTYFTTDNAARIDAIREAIDILTEQQRCSQQERCILLTSLLFAADKAANTVGQYDAFLKHIDRDESVVHSDKHLIDSNVHKPLQLRVPEIEPLGNRGNEVYNTDANRLIQTLEAEVVYLDPPYNNRQYIDCYHVLENILCWNKPALNGKTRKFPREHLKSRYSRKTQAAAALEELVQATRAEHIFLSYNNEGIIQESTIREILGKKGSVEVFSRDYAVFGNGAGSSRKRTLIERIYYCRCGSGRQMAAPAAAATKIELFNEQGESRGFYSLKNRLNDLTGKEWVYWSKSVINKPYPPNLQHKLRSSHGGQKPPDLCGDLIEVFTKRGQRVLDPFAGVGGTLLGAALRGRSAVGIEINPRWIEIYHQVCSLEKILRQRMICADSRVALARLADEEAPFDLILTDVPYWRMDTARKSKGKYKRVGEAQKKSRQTKLSVFNNNTYSGKEHWLRDMREVFTASLPLVKARGYVVVFIGDMYNSGSYHFLSSDLAAILSELGLIAKANLIWYDVSKSLHIYGYQYEYIPSMIHQNILVFRKEP
jgi:adenine-specific DNA methylase/DNA modification methylase